MASDLHGPDGGKPKPLLQIGAIIFVLTTVFYAGAMYRRIVVLENWRIQVTSRAEIYDARIRAVEALHAGTQADLASIKAALARIERSIDSGDNP